MDTESLLLSIIPALIKNNDIDALQHLIPYVSKEDIVRIMLIMGRGVPIEIASQQEVQEYQHRIFMRHKNVEIVKQPQQIPRNIYLMQELQVAKKCDIHILAKCLSNTDYSYLMIIYLYHLGFTPSDVLNLNHKYHCWSFAAYRTNTLLSMVRVYGKDIISIIPRILIYFLINNHNEGVELCLSCLPDNYRLWAEQKKMQLLDRQFEEALK